MAAECTGLGRGETTCLRAASLSFPCTARGSGLAGSCGGSVCHFPGSGHAEFRGRSGRAPACRRPHPCASQPGAAGPALRIVPGLVGPVLPVASEPDQQPLPTPLSGSLGTSLSVFTTPGVSISWLFAFFRTQKMMEMITVQ